VVGGGVRDRHGIRSRDTEPAGAANPTPIDPSIHGTVHVPWVSSTTSLVLLLLLPLLLVVADEEEEESMIMMMDGRWSDDWTREGATGNDHTKTAALLVLCVVVCVSVVGVYQSQVFGGGLCTRSKGTTNAERRVSGESRTHNTR
jgi:hypothetical protein